MNESPAHNVVVIREWRHANVDKQRKLLVGVDVTPPRARPKPCDCSLFCIKKCTQLGIMVSSKAAIIWATSRENLSSRCPTKSVSKQSPQLQRLNRKLKFHLQKVYI